MPVKRFVILAAPRTGSNLLCTLLNSHPWILCHHEVFNPRGIFYAIDHRDGSIDLGTVTERDRAPVIFLERLWNETKGKRHVGFKMTSGQHADILNRVLGDDSVQKIILSRANRVRTYVSYQLATRTDQWEVYDERVLAREVPRLKIDARELKAHAESNAAFYAELEATLHSTGQSWLAVDYQGLLLRTTHERLLAYLDAGPAPLLATSVRRNPWQLESLNEYFGELAAVLETSDYHAELHERQEMADDG